MTRRQWREVVLYGVLRDPRSRILTRQDVHRYFGGRWSHDSIEIAIADLVGRTPSLLAEDAYGRLICGPDAGEYAA